MNTSDHQLLITIAKCLAVPLLLGIGAGIKWTIDSWRASRTTSYDQLNNLFGVLERQLARKEVADTAKDREIEKLCNEVDALTLTVECVKVIARTARIDLIDLRESTKCVRHFLRNEGHLGHDICNTVNDLENKLKEIGECLKINSNNDITQIKN